MSNSLKNLKAALSLLAIFACLGARALARDAADRNSIAAVKAQNEVDARRGARAHFDNS